MFRNGGDSALARKRYTNRKSRYLLQQLVCCPAATGNYYSRSQNSRPEEGKGGREDIKVSFDLEHSSRHHAVPRRFTLFCGCSYPVYCWGLRCLLLQLLPRKHRILRDSPSPHSFTRTAETMQIPVKTATSPELIWTAYAEMATAAPTRHRSTSVCCSIRFKPEQS